MILFPLSFWNKDNGPPPPPDFVPTDLAQLIFWRNGAQADSIVVDGSNRLVIQSDLSGNGVNIIPDTDFTSPLLLTNVLNGASLLRLSNTEACRLETSLLPFDPGWDYQGPIVHGHVMKFKLPAGAFDSITSFFNSGFFQFFGFGENSATYDVLGKVLIETALTTGPKFLTAAWPGAIYAPAPAYCTVGIVSFKGTSRNEAFLYVRIAPSGTIPGYFATLAIDTIHKSLCCSFRSGAGTAAGVELYEAESFMSLEDSPSVPTASVRKYLTRWMGTIPRGVICHGDSLTGGFGIGLGLAYPYRLGLQATGQEFINVGINGRTLATLADDQPAYASLIRPSGMSVLIWAMTNDIAADEVDAATGIARLITLATLWKAAGCKVYAMDCIPRNFGAPFAGNPQNAAKEAIRIQFNSALAALSNPNVDQVIRLTSHAPFNDVNQWNSTAFYDPDQVHLNAAGYQAVADIVFDDAFAE